MKDELTYKIKIVREGLTTISAIRARITALDEDMKKISNLDFKKRLAQDIADLRIEMGREKEKVRYQLDKLQRYLDNGNSRLELETGLDWGELVTEFQSVQGHLERHITELERC